MGASDQIGNFHSGIHLIRRFKDQQVYGMALPLIVDEEGNKYGKSLGNPVWLSPSKRPAFEFYQFFLRLPDIHVEQFLRQFTFLKEDQIESTMQKKLRSKDPYVAHRLLAEQITLLVHGSDALRVAQLATQILYEKSVDAVAQLTHRDLERIFDASQVTELMLEPGETTVLDLAIKSKAFVHSIDAVRTIQQGAFSINQVKVTDPSRTIDNSHILPNLTTLLKIGKKRFYLIKWKWEENISNWFGFIFIQLKRQKRKLNQQVLEIEKNVIMWKYDLVFFFNN